MSVSASENVTKLAQMAERKILKGLNISFEEHARSATFACGGSLPFHATPGKFGATAQECAGESVHENVEDSAGIKDGEGPEESAEEGVEEYSEEYDERTLNAIDDVQVRFGISGQGYCVNFGQDGPSKDFKYLLDACQPASFGRGGEAVLDEKYRKAGKLDRSEFATNFCPYEAGIIDVLTQLLVPEYKYRNLNSIKAELYKLNIYSAPNGKFRPHVDTPRNEYQIGSLVVSLPSKHTGGQLTVGNSSADSQSVIFDWSSQDKKQPACIKWAAFYSDCPHEVHQVTAGHRVTLTYNLFLRRGVGHIAESSPALDPTQLPVYGALRDALEVPSFLNKGRVLAVYLTHRYAHTDNQLNFLPDSLKGADMALWTAVRALDLTCKLVPIMRAEHWSGKQTDIFEPEFSSLGETVTGGYVMSIDYQWPGWGHKIPKDANITWLNGKRGDLGELQLAYATHGNQPEVETHYSYAAMLILVPPYSERGNSDAASAEFPADFWDASSLDSDERLDD
ncbi:unnamed protein product [Periconia digitata]|uniref:Fe2OG dioxygenase domain-containing protein n=1 Tax=Periconia digitata TaxID=1303443 RepID=A0A9W4XI42_9PLEO|nr:unnamed protein product [Periconia digitata]